MNCEQAIQHVTLQAYCELSADEQEALELHMHGCPECVAERDAVAAFGSVMQNDTLPEVPPNLLAASRMRLDDALDETPSLSLVDRARNLLVSTWHSLAHAPALAALLVGVGFLSGNTLNRYQVAHEPHLPTPVVLQNSTQGVVGSVSGVVQTPNSEVVEVKYNRIVPETMQGSLDDPQIRQLLMAAAQHGTDNDVREQSVGLLASECRAGHQCEAQTENGGDGRGFRDALLVSLRYDKSPQVRMKALEGLQPFVRLDQRVRDAVLESLMRDPSSTVRTRAISLLEPVHADSSVRQVLHTVSTQDDNPYIRTASMQALEGSDGIQ
jgi:hypothetical protein